MISRSLTTFLVLQYKRSAVTMLRVDLLTLEQRSGVWSVSLAWRKSVMTAVLRGTFLILFPDMLISPSARLMGAGVPAKNQLGSRTLNIRIFLSPIVYGLCTQTRSVQER